MINIKTTCLNQYQITALYYCFLILFILINGTPAYAQRDLSKLVEQIAPSIVLVRVYDERNNIIGVGSGFFVKREGVVVTNYHVIEEGFKAFAKLSTGEILPIESILAEDQGGDLALLKIGIKGRSFSPLNLSKTNIKTGQPVVVIGSPFGLEGTVSDGIISAIRDIPNIGKILQISAPISKGSSGSPVLNTNGEVIGIATATFKYGQNINFAIHVDRLNSLISRAEKYPSYIGCGDIYKDAYEALNKENLELARKKFESFLLKCPNTELSDNAQFWIGETYYLQKDFVKATKEYEKVIANYPDGDKVPAALYKQAFAFLKLGNNRKAKTLLTRLIEQYPYSDQAELAREMELTKPVEKKPDLRPLQEALEEIRKKALIDEIRKKMAQREKVEERPTMPLPVPPPVNPPSFQQDASLQTPPKSDFNMRDMYYSLIWAKIKESWTIPENLIKEMVDLETIIVLIIEQDGKIRKSWFEKKSGNPLYDQMAMRAILKAEPLPPIPKELNENTIEIKVPFIQENDAPTFVKIPIVLSKWKSMDRTPPALTAKVYEILTDDLTLSGFFRVIDHTNLPTFLQKKEGIPSTLFLGEWIPAGGEVLLAGEVHLESDHLTCRLKFHLIDLVEQKHLAGKQYEGPLHSLRNMVHRITDEVILRLTGKSRTQ